MTLETHCLLAGVLLSLTADLVMPRIFRRDEVLSAVRWVRTLDWGSRHD